MKTSDNLYSISISHYPLPELSPLLNCPYSTVNNESKAYSLVLLDFRYKYYMSMRNVKSGVTVDSGRLLLACSSAGIMLCASSSPCRSLLVTWKGSYLCPLRPHEKSGGSSWLPHLDQPSSGCWSHSRGEPVDGRFVSLSLPLCKLSLSNKNGWIFKKELKKISLTTDLYFSLS